MAATEVYDEQENDMEDQDEAAGEPMDVDSAGQQAQQAETSMASEAKPRRPFNLRTSWGASKANSKKTSSQTGGADQSKAKKKGAALSKAASSTEVAPAASATATKPAKRNAFARAFTRARSALDSSLLYFAIS